MGSYVSTSVGKGAPGGLSFAEGGRMPGLGVISGSMSRGKRFP